MSTYEYVSGKYMKYHTPYVKYHVTSMVAVETPKYATWWMISWEEYHNSIKTYQQLKHSRYHIERGKEENGKKTAGEEEKNRVL